MFGPLRTPHPQGISNPLCGGSMDIFWNYTMGSACVIFVNPRWCRHVCHGTTEKNANVLMRYKIKKSPHYETHAFISYFM